MLIQLLVGGDADSTFIPGHLVAGLPNDWTVYCTPSGYQSKAGMRAWAVAFVRHIKVFESNCIYNFMDGFEDHFDFETLKFLYENHVRCIFFRSQSSVTYQPMDNGPNELLDKKYNDAISHWRIKHPCIPFTSGFFKEVIVEAWKNIHLLQIIMM